MLNLKSTIIMGLFPISLCIGLGVLLYNMHFGYNSLTSEQAIALSYLNDLYDICVKYSNTNLNDEGTIRDYTQCINILNNPEFIKALQSLDCFYKNIEATRKDFMEALINIDIHDPNLNNRMAHRMSILSNHIKIILDKI